MRISIQVPDLRANDEPIRVSGWFVDVGDRIVPGDLIAELLIPGMTFDLIAESSGRLVELTKAVDEQVRAGETLGWLESD